MKKIKIDDREFTKLLSYRKIKSHIKKIARDLNDDFEYVREPVVLLCVLKGSMMFTCELMKYLKFPVELATIGLSSYSGTTSTGEIKITSKLSTDVKNRKVIVVEDIVETGLTIEFLQDYLLKKKVNMYKFCTLFYKPGKHIYGPAINYPWTSIVLGNNDFVVGFGLDYNGLGRNLKDLYKTKAC